MKTTKIFISILTAIWLFGLAPEGFPQDYPTKAIRLIVPYAAGGGTDVLARTLQNPLGKELGTNIVVENISAGATKVGTLELLKARPDGYTLLLVGPEVYVGYYYSGTYEFKPWERLTFIGNTGEEPYGFVEIRTDGPYQTWAELVKYAKQNPGKVTGGGPGAGGMVNLIFNEITKDAGIDARYIPFDGSGPAKNALLGGHLDFRCCMPSEAIIMIRAGKTKGIAVSSPERFMDLKDVPTFKELGIGKSLENPMITKAIFGPPNLPQNRVDKIAKALEKVVNGPDFAQYGQKFLYQPKFKDGKQTKEETIKFDTIFGPKFEALYKKLRK